MYMHLHLMLILSQQWCEECSLLIARLLERGKLQVVCIFKKAGFREHIIPPSLNKGDSNITSRYKLR